MTVSKRLPQFDLPPGLAYKLLLLFDDSCNQYFVASIDAPLRVGEAFVSSKSRGTQNESIPFRSRNILVSAATIHKLNIGQRSNKAGSQSQSANRRGIHEEDSRVHDRAILQFTFNGLSPLIAKGADT